jgi:prevent-host-death family protein
VTARGLADVRHHLSDVVDEVNRTHDRVTITRHGEPVAVVMAPADLEELEETLETAQAQRDLARLPEKGCRRGVRVRRRSAARQPLPACVRHVETPSPERGQRVGVLPSDLPAGGGRANSRPDGGAASAHPGHGGTLGACRR